MAIFQKSVIKKHLNNLNKDLVDKAYLKFKANYNPKKIEEIKTLKEEEYQDGFLRDIFVDVLGYTLKPDENFNLHREFKNQTDSKKADGAILTDGKVIAVIELKSTTTKDLKSVVQQAFNYKNNQPGCKYVITSNFKKLNFYIDYSNEREEFDLFHLNREKFEKFYLILSKESIVSNLPLKIKEETKFHEQKVSEKLYKDYSHFKSKLFETITKNHPESDKLILFKKTQKLIDRFLFILFAEDSGLLPPNSISRIIDTYHKLEELDAYKPIYDIFKQYFGYMNIGRKGKTTSGDIPAYNGGLFHIDKLLDNLKIDDEILINELLNLSQYDFNTEVDVNILGHIFEHSLNEIEEVTAEIEGTATDKSKSRRKKEGVFYTPKYITQYIVENTIGTLCNEKRKELDIVEIEFDGTYRTKGEKLSQKGIKLYKKLKNYKDWLITLKIIDPACGSGAFLNQALNFLIEEHKNIDDIISELTNSPLRLFDIDKSILENNLHGVDINEESVEIAKLSLWIRTAQKGRKLSNLNNNIKCGNSLIDDLEIAGEKAFDWNVEFKEIMDDGGFDVVIGNPPYVFARDNISKKLKDYYIKNYISAEYQINTYLLFIEQTIKIIHDKANFGLIIPNAWLMVNSAKGLRNFILQNCSVNEIINLAGYSFEGVNVETIIILATKTKYKLENNSIKVLLSEGKDFKYSHNRNQSDFEQNEGFEFKVFSDETSVELIKKLKSNSKNLNDLVHIKAGLQAYEKNKGEPKQTIEDVKNRPYDYNFKYDRNTHKYLEGKDVGRYFINWSGQYLQYGKQLASPRTFNLFDGEKIIIREITGKYPKSIISTYSDKLYLYNRSNIAIIKREELKISLKYVNSILNSQLMAYYFVKNTAKSVRKMFPKIILNDLRKFPFKDLSELEQKPFIENTDHMLDINLQLQEKINKFLYRTQDNLEIKKISKKLNSFYSYGFKTFITELKKQKIILSLLQQDEWEDYFNSYKNEIGKIKMDITKTDNEIDQMVYELYGLNEKEIEIIENG